MESLVLEAQSVLGYWLIQAVDQHWDEESRTMHREVVLSTRHDPIDDNDPLVVTNLLLKEALSALDERIREEPPI